MQCFAIAVRCLITVVFLAAVVGKVATRAGFAAFVESVHALRLLPSPLVRPAALGTIAAEFAVLVLLWLPRFTVAGSMLATAMLTGLAVAIVLALRRGVRAPCRCFGASVIPLGPRHVVRNTVLAGLALSGVVAGPPASTTMRPEWVVLGAAAGALAGGLIAALDGILALFQPLDTGFARGPSGPRSAGVSSQKPNQKELSDVVRDRGRDGGGRAVRAGSGADPRRRQTAARTY
ncbi:MauE/DoxX family redox-associated membrane protein [Krasilnikovia sp. MM14-A1259]|uniref:MauE/DoxX family redox-associated membrane protein n=1 Tax=Krasilnikovia sp. MM14-A1259 TaxID=3373539 RepID=UPI0038264EC7